MYDGPNYGGRVLLVRQQNAEFNNDFFNDRVESIHLNGNCKWLFYEHTNFYGQVHFLNIGYYSSAPSWGGSGNRISSARVLPSQGTVAIVLFQHSYFKGRMIVLYGSNSHLHISENFGDTISSAIVLGGSWTLFQHAYFGGSSTTLGAGDYTTIHNFNVGGDSVSSVRLN